MEHYTEKLFVQGGRRLNGTIEISARDKSMKELVPEAEAVDFVYDYVKILNYEFPWSFI